MTVRKLKAEGELISHEFAFCFRALGLSQVTQLGKLVFKAYNANYGLVVVKLAQSRIGKMQLNQESLFLSNHPSPHWPTLHDSGCHNGISWIMTEYVAGETLSATPYSERLKLLKQLEHCLQECHSTGYIHGDIKPDNILVTPNHLLYLVDFGSVLPIDCPFSQLETSSWSRGYTSPFMEKRIGKVEKSYDYYALALSLSMSTNIDGLHHINSEKAPYFSALPARYQHLVLSHLNHTKRLSTLKSNA